MDSGTAPGVVVVGVDGSAADTAALRWAVEEARRRPARLCLMHALNQRHSGAFHRANPTFAPEERRVAAADVLAAAGGQARALAGDVDVHPVLEVGPPAVALLRQAGLPTSWYWAPGAVAASPVCCWVRRHCRW